MSGRHNFAVKIEVFTADGRSVKAHHVAYPGQNKERALELFGRAERAILRVDFKAPIAGEVTIATARPRSEWHEDIGPVLWWFFPITEPPYVGTPLDSEWPLHDVSDNFDEVVEADLCTHWTPIPIPADPTRAPTDG
jgi:hypothetical protein